MKSIFFLSLYYFLPGVVATIFLPKPNGLLKLQYPDAAYIQSTANPSILSIINKPILGGVLSRPTQLCTQKMKASLYLSYVPVTKNLDSLLTDAYKLPSKHISKAQEIQNRVFYQS